MVSLSFPIEEKTLKEMQGFQWVNWSKVACEAVKNKEILESYLKTGQITKENWDFCERLDWHPADELPFKEEFIKELKERENGQFVKASCVEEIFKE
jgi:hypothetical protein